MHPAFDLGDGSKVGEQELAIPKARQFADLLARGLPFVKLLHFERQQSSGIEAAVIQVEVELGQKSVHPIQRFEPLAFLFDPRDELGQTVLALREGFPITPHQRISPRSEPRTLCLYEEPYAEQKLRWSPFALIEAARDWLRLTARGELHQDDQPLEPLMATAEVTAILPHDFYQSTAGKDFIPMAAARFEDSKNLFALVVPKPEWQKVPNPEFVLSPFISPAVEHGIITHQPTTLLQLHQFCQSVSLDLLKDLRDRIRAWKTGANSRQFSASKLILCVVFPKLRRAEGQPESRETWLFITRATLQELATTLGVLDSKTINGFAGVIIGSHDVRTEGADKVEILPMRPTFVLDKQTASTLNSTIPSDLKIVAIGLGALGSQTFDNLARSGFGSWTLIDKDFLLPHNCARHVLDGSAVPLAKAEAMRARSMGMVADVPVQAIVADILNPGDKAEPVHKSIDAADAVLDMSASVAVSKYLALDLKASARRAAAFLNPNGDTLILLIENQGRTIPLDWLEMHYYMALTANDNFADHFKSPGRFRYSRSCGDISSRISQDLIALHAATASRALRAALGSPEALLLLCKAQPDFSTKSYTIPVNPSLLETVEGWTILTNPAVITEAHRLRQTKLPSETGGVLLGSVDVAHQRIYITGLLPSPRDSKEWPNLYIRGAAGLRKRVEEISKATYDNIGYIAEWHSHPPRSSANASPTDRIALSKLADEMTLAGLPALMLIVADRNRHQYHIFAGRGANGEPRKRQRKKFGALSCL